MNRATITMTLAGVLSLCAAWMINPPGSPALYDGICAPSQYRHVGSNSPGVPPPQPASETVPLSNGQVPTIQLIADNDQDPQAQILINTGSIAVPAGTAAITVSIRALPAPAVQPVNAKVDGNLYEFSITTDTGRPVTLNQSPTITLRTASGSGKAVIGRFDGNKWTNLKSASVGCTNSPIAAITILGAYAAITPATTSSPTAPAKSSPPLALFFALVAAFIILLLGGITRRRRTRKPTA